MKITYYNGRPQVDVEDKTQARHIIDSKYPQAVYGASAPFASENNVLYWNQYVYDSDMLKEASNLGKGRASRIACIFWETETDD